MEKQFEVGKSTMDTVVLEGLHGRGMWSRWAMCQRTLGYLDNWDSGTVQELLMEFMCPFCILQPLQTQEYIERMGSYSMEREAWEDYCSQFQNMYAGKAKGMMWEFSQALDISRVDWGGLYSYPTVLTLTLLHFPLGICTPTFAIGMKPNHYQIT